MANPYAPPLLDFSPLANLGETFFNARSQARKDRYDEEAPKLLSQLYDSSGGAPSATVPQTMPLAPLGQGAAPTFAAGGAGRSMTMPADPALAPAIKKYAQEAGLDPVDVATAMSYETGGTFDPWKAGPTTKWGQHRGLIQWGEPQAAQYGVSRDTPVDQQVAASIKYLRDRGVKPGMGLMDIYSAINAGSVGRYNASDAAAGGAPGAVADKVNNQMGAHREKAMALLGLSPADVPASGAREAQFQIPGQGGMAPAQAASGPQPISRELFSSLAANPNTRAIAGQILASRLNPQSAFDFQTVGDQLVRVNKRTGAVEAVPGFTKPSNQWSRLNDGTLYNQQTGETRPVDGAQAPGMFSGNSVDAQALNELVRTGQLTREQAAQFAAGKTVTGPNGEQLFLTPQGVFSAPAPNAAPPSGTAAATPGATPPRDGVIPLTSAKPEKPTEGQSNAALYARRMVEANEVLSKPEITAAMQSRKQGVLHKLPGGNSLVLKEFQQADQAKRNFINSVLRRESGAVISPEEFANADLQYFPQPGDDPETLRQKAQNRQTAIEGITSAAGPAAPKQDGGWTDIGGVKIRRKQ